MPNPSPAHADFAQDFLSRLAAHPQFHTASYDADDFACVLGSGEDGGHIRIYLENLFRDCTSASAADRDRRVNHFISQLVAMAAGREADATTVSRALPVLRTANFAFCSSLNMQKHAPEGAPCGDVITRPVGGDLIAALIIDSASNISSVGVKDLQQWGLSKEQAWGHALRNLSALTPAKWQFGKGKMSGLFVLHGDFAESARLLLPDFGRHLPVKGDLIVMAATKTTLLATGHEDREGQAAMVAEFMRLSDKGGCLSPTVLRRSSAEDWQPYGLWVPQAELLREVQIEVEFENVKQQASAIASCLHPTDPIGSFHLTSPPNDRAPCGESPIPCVVWPTEGRALIPRTPLVQVRSQDGLRVLWWQTVESLAANWITDTGFAVPWRLVSALPEKVIEKMILAEASRY